MKTYTILVVDDKPDNLKTIVEYLKKSEVQFTILKAPDGKIACKLAEKKLPDLIITDWEMPVMNGIETIEHLKRLEKTKDIPVIMATGVMTSPKNLKTALEAGAIDYIRKPIDEIELTARVNSVLKLSDSLKEIKSLNAIKAKFFAIIAHDLKSPFSAMLGFSKILIENFDNYDISKQKEYLSYIYQSVQRIFKLLENLLLWSLAQKGVISFKPGRQKLSNLSVEAIELLDQLAENKSITLNNEIPEDIVVKADKNMLSTIIRNLISNAIKFTRKGGVITLNACSVSDENEQPNIKVTVKDTGVGISPKRQSKLFKISENHTTKGTDKEKGTGIGLILCREFVEIHGGKIWVESEVGKGSSFHFTIPVK